MKRVVTFGEVMLRLAPPDHLRLTQTDRLEMTFGGAEVNVAVALAQLGTNAAFVTRLPKNDVAQACVQQIRGLGVDTQHITRGGERMGIYFVEKGAAQRASTVLYDRASSAIATAEVQEWNWPTIFENAAVFHVTGITPALSESAARASLDAAAAARAANILVTCDLNFRKKLWSADAARETMSELLQNVDVCIANEEDAEAVFGISAGQTDVTGGTLDHDRYADVAAQMMQKFPNLKGVAITLRESFSASRNGWSGMLFWQNRPYFSRRYEIDIVDRVGGGDAFAAGLIYALLREKNPQETVEFAAALSCLKHTIPGDFCAVKLSEVETLLAGDASGRVQR